MLAYKRLLLFNPRDAFVFLGALPGVIEEGGSPALVMQLYPLGSLQDMMSSDEYKALSLKDRISIVLQVRTCNASLLFYTARGDLIHQHTYITHKWYWVKQHHMRPRACMRVVRCTFYEASLAFQGL